jgi:hypothetical protein
LWELRVRRDGWSVEEGRAKGREDPEWYAEQPELLHGDELFMRAYWTLDSERSPTSGGASRIPWSSTMAYADRIGLAPDVGNILWAVVSSMDFAYLSFISKRSSKDNSGEDKANRREARKSRTEAAKSGAAEARRSSRKRKRAP